MTQSRQNRMIADGGIDFRAEYTTVPDIHDICLALAAIEDIPATELNPLYNHVEIEALTRLIRHADEHDCTVGVEFTFQDHTVVVDDKRTIQIHDEDPMIVESGKNGEEK